MTRICVPWSPLVLRNGREVKIGVKVKYAQPIFIASGEGDRFCSFHSYALFLIVLKMPNNEGTPSQDHSPGGLMRSCLWETSVQGSCPHYWHEA